MTKTNNKTNKTTTTNTNEEEMKMTNNIIGVKVYFTDGTETKIEGDNEDAVCRESMDHIASLYSDKVGKTIDYVVYMTLEGENVTEVKNEEDVEMKTKREELFDNFDKIVEQGAELLSKTGNNGYFKILKSKDEDIYDEFYDALIEASMRFRASGNKEESDKAEELIDDLEDSIDEAEELGLKEKVVAYIAFVFKKTVALLKGTALFTFDATTILATMVGRIAYNTVIEMKGASIAIARAFREDVYEPVKNA